MRQLVRKVLEVLDGTPAEYGRKPQAGQSLVEIAFITPLLLILLAGMIEVAVLASNYQALQEVTRVGARRGTVLTGDNGPMAWNNRGSLVPRTRWNNSPWETPPAGSEFIAFDPAADENERQRYRNCGSVNTADFGFYNLIICTMLRSLDPLPFRGGTDPDQDTSLSLRERFYPDDIIVSAFGLQLITIPTDIDPTSYPGVTATYQNGPRIYVVSRYPTNANECNVDMAGNQVAYERDPFDWLEDNTRNCELATCADTNPLWLELEGGDTGKEFQRGFAWFGQHRITEDEWNPDAENMDCIGSQFTIDRVQSLMNLPGFDLNNEQREFLPTQGMVLVEMYWRHDLFLAFPLFSPIYDMLGERTTISAWAAFPAPGAEPNISFIAP